MCENESKEQLNFCFNWIRQNYTVIQTFFSIFIICRIWKFSTTTNNCQLIHQIEGLHSRTIRYLSWSSNGELLAQASFDGTVTVLHFDPSFSTYRLVSRLEGHESEVKCVEWSPNLQWLVSCGRDKTVWIWNYIKDDDDFECYAIKQEHSQDVKCICWHSTNSQVFFSGSYDGTVRVWNHDAEMDEWECIQTINAFFPSSNFPPPTVGHGLGIGGKLPGTIWSISTPPKKETLSNALSDSFVCAGEDGRMQEYQFDQSTQRWTLVFEVKESLSNGPIYCINWHPNESLSVAIGTADGTVVELLREEPVKQNEICKTLSWTVGRTFTAPLHSDVHSLCWLLEGKFLVYCTDSGAICVEPCAKI